MKRIFIILFFVGSALFGADSTATLKPSEEYLELTNNKFFIEKFNDFVAPDSNGAYSPKKAFWFSAVCPGFGQFYNRKPIKGMLFMYAEFYHVAQSIYYNDLDKNRVQPYIKELKSMIGSDGWYSLSTTERTEMLRDSTDYDLSMNYWKPKERRNKRIWWCAGIYIISMLDAYVDAHLSDYPTGDMEFINDTANKSKGVKISFKLKRGIGW